MRKIVAAILLCSLALTAHAVPAKRGWQTRTQADGSSIEVQVIGDEFYHYTINREGKQIRLNEAGMYEVVGEAPSAAKVQARRANARRARREFGVTPNLAPRGIVILVNFTDKSFAASHTRTVVDSLCNAKDCQVNKHGTKAFPSAGQYFLDQSNGLYHPVFDVYGPVNLSHNMKYYGENDENGNDMRPAVAVVEACKQLESSVDFTLYDSDNDGKVDFVYMIYAGEGEHATEVENQIWPHAFSIDEEFEYEDTYFTDVYPTKNSCKVDGKQINTYACSSELSGSDLDGIGTLCHEFSHVMGLPDFYDTKYGNNYENHVTPNDWDVMDGGSYNEDGHCPPNYSAWEKYFFGWHTPVNLGNEGQNLTLYASGTENYQAYQINTSGSLITATTAGECYYIENRQAVGWDRGLPHHGLLIWKVNYNQSAWVNNEPNNTSGNPRYTLASAYGTTIGTYLNSSQTAYVYDGPKNPYPGSKNVTTKTIANKPLLNIAESNQLITLTYIEEPVVPVDPFDVVFKVNGVDFETVESTGKLVLPENEPSACQDGRVFMGWCTSANYSSQTTAPTFAQAGQAVQEGAVFYAVFADQEGEGGAAVNDELTLATTGVSGTNYADWSGKTGASGAVYAGQSAGGNNAIQLRSKNSNSGIITTTSGGKVSKITVVWNSSTSGRTLDVYGKSSAYSSPADLYGTNKGTKIGSIASDTDTELTVEGEYTYIGLRSNSGALWLDKITITWGGGASYSNYSTSCGGGESIVETIGEQEKTVKKAIRNGQLVIIRGEEVYSITGERIE